MRRINRPLAIAACLAGLVLVLLSTGTSGGLGRFSPQTLEYETRSEFTILAGGLPIYCSVWQPTDNEVVTYIQQAGLVKPQPNATRQWELVFHWNRAWRDGYGQLDRVLGRYRKSIIARSQADEEWARDYWTEGFKYLRSNDPVDVWIGGEILNRGSRTETVRELRAEIVGIKQDSLELRD